jgi:hypothetical protein
MLVAPQTITQNTNIRAVLLLKPCVSLIYAWKPTNAPIINSIYWLYMVAPTCFGITLPSSGQCNAETCRSYHTHIRTILCPHDWDGRRRNVYNKNSLTLRWHNLYEYTLYWCLLNFWCGLLASSGEIWTVVGFCYMSVLVLVTDTLFLLPQKKKVILVGGGWWNMLGCCRAINDKSLFNLLKTKHWPLYLNPQSVPHCKHFSSRL